MPLYEYECDAGHRFELIRKFSDPPLEKCPTCGAPVHKLFSSPAIQFKGSGFYITDYAKKETPASPSGESKSDTESKDKEKSATGEKSEKSEKGLKGDKAEKSEKSGEKSEKSSTTETAKPSSSEASTASAPKKDTK